MIGFTRNIEQDKRMTLEDRITAFVELGTYINDNRNAAEINELIQLAEKRNPWFIKEFTLSALHGISSLLEKEKLEAWISGYDVKDQNKTVGLVMAGNIPMVGFHDVLSVLISGNIAKIKYSSKDDVLLPFLLRKLIEIEPAFHKMIIKVDTVLKDYDAVIATGSNNSARYFEYYFKNADNIIRRNRTSVAVLTGNETQTELQGLVDDIMLYFGLGCRSITKLYIPESFDVRVLYEYVEKYDFMKNHFKFFNNYEYNRSVYLVNRIEHFDNGYFILKPDEGMHSPIAVLFYEKYTDIAEVKKQLEADKDTIQCIVAKNNIFYKKNIKPGNAQYPALNDYADDVDTIAFLTNI